jgi:uncharacterized protein (TIGR00375 family)
MGYVADLHIHSPYAYATSKALTLENLCAWAGLKGIDLLASADFTHPAWFRELQEKLTPDGGGLYQMAGGPAGISFILGTEVSCVYQQDGRLRRVHLLLFAPSLEVVDRLNRRLSRHGNLNEDGRPTLGLSARDLTALALDTHPECIVVPAHAWTPWYGVYGSKSGFDRLDQCFGDMMPAVTAIETGLSSDPAMNWPVAELADKTILSFSDAHSLPKLGREVTVFGGEPSYPGFARALSGNRVAYTVEFYPEEGKYHYDGHRKCGVVRSPQETLREGLNCPVCRRPLTLGVLHRTGLLGDGDARFATGEDGFVRSPQGRPPFIRLIPLQEIISDVIGVGVNSKRVQEVYLKLVRELAGELRVLMECPPEELEAAAGEELAQAIVLARRGQVQIEPGYDGVFGRISLPKPARDESLGG